MDTIQKFEIFDFESEFKGVHEFERIRGEFEFERIPIRSNSCEFEPASIVWKHRIIFLSETCIIRRGRLGSSVPNCLASASFLRWERIKVIGAAASFFPPD